ncbi:peptidase S8/S53 domain-containing protein [Sporodiniella umbellata]|nr:peptidase S8/S53 domain-containing protein [Sporodiniella umbellata]
MHSIIFVFFLQWIITVQASRHVAPIVTELKDTEHYVIIFKQNISAVDIDSQLQRIRTHQTSVTYNTTAHMMSKKINQYNAIGNFKWYHAQFNTSLENYLKTDTSVEDTVHYWVKDALFSMQEFIQKNPPSWGLDRIDQRKGTDNEYRFSKSQGSGVTVYLMDTGVNPNHQDIAGRVRLGKTVVGDITDASDHNGHGTFVAGVCCGTKFGVAKNASIVSVKTLDSSGNGRLSDVLVGLHWIVEQHMSQKDSKSIVNQPTNDAITQAISLGIHFSIAAGNYGEDACQYSPGSTSGAITVGAFDEDDSVSYYSNFGKCVDIFAPGTNIQSIWPTSNDATHTLTGTSMAAPHVTGTMAILLSEQNYTPLELANIIKNTSTLRTEDFVLNNTGIFYSENKTVVDNAIDLGVPTLMSDKTRVNLLYSQPSDGDQFWIYGRALSLAPCLSKKLPIVLICLSVVFVGVL